MNLRQLGGWALLANALIGVVLTIWGIAGDDSGASLLLVANLVAEVLLLVGLPAIQATQPQTGRLGQLGLIGLGLAAAIAFVVNLIFLTSANPDVPQAVPFASALLGLVGALLVGWVTLQARVFPAWVGVVLIVGGILNIAGGFLPDSPLADVNGRVASLLLAAALAGYGWGILRQAGQANVETPPALG